MSKLPPGVKPDDIHSISTYARTGHPLTDALHDLFAQAAHESPTGFLDSSDLEHALLFHLIQNLRGTPAHYKKKRIASVVKLIREASYLPVPTTFMSGGGNA